MRASNCGAFVGGLLKHQVPTGAETESCRLRAVQWHVVIAQPRSLYGDGLLYQALRLRHDRDCSTAPIYDMLKICIAFHVVRCAFDKSLTKKKI
jgi:hypothetical protein